MKRITAVTIAVVLLTACAVYAQQSDDMFMEKLWNTHTGFDAPQTGTFEGAMVEAGYDTNAYDFNLEAFEGISLARNFQRQAIEDETLPLARAIRESTTSTLEWQPLENMSMHFTSNITETRDLMESELSSFEEQIFGFSQQFGGGPSTSQLNFARETTVKRSNGETSQEKVVQKYNFTSGLAENWDLSMKFIDTEQALKDSTSQDFASALKFPLSGGEGSAAFQSSRSFKGGELYEGQIVDLHTPFAIRGGDAVFSHHKEFADQGKTRFNRESKITSPLDFLGHEGQFEHFVTENLTSKGKETERRRTQIVTPLRLWGSKCSLEHVIDKQLKDATWNKQYTWILDAPFEVGGKSVAHKQTFISQNRGGVDTDSMITHLRVPLAGDTAKVQRRIDNRPATSSRDEWKRERLIVETPAFRVGDLAAFTAEQSRTQVEGKPGEKNTKFDLTLKPVSRLDVNASWNMQDEGPGRGVRERDIHSVFNLTDNLHLQYDFNQEEAIENTATVQRRLLLEQKAKKGLNLRAGYVSYGLPGEELKPAGVVEMQVGRDEDLLVDAKYMEYNPDKPDKFISDKSEPLVGVILQHRPSKNKLLRFKYADEKGRVDPERGLDLSFEALGSNWRLGFLKNPILSGEKKVTQADRYDATVGRPVFGSLKLEMGMLYYDYATDDYEEFVDQHYMFELCGGQVERGGELALSFRSGELIIDGKKRNPVPRSVFDLSYSRRWGSDGRLKLVVSREAAPNDSIEEDEVSGRLEYDVSF
ncbi:MAG: hypothetical protein R6V19_09420 [Armatimonadota bacterium]